MKKLKVQRKASLPKRTRSLRSGQATLLLHGTVRKRAYLHSAAVYIQIYPHHAATPRLPRITHLLSSYPTPSSFVNSPKLWILLSIHHWVHVVYPSYAPTLPPHVHPLLLHPLIFGIREWPPLPTIKILNFLYMKALLLSHAGFQMMFQDPQDVWVDVSSLHPISQGYLGHGTE